MTPMAVSNQWPHDDIHRQRAMPPHHDYPMPPSNHRYPAQQPPPPSPRSHQPPSMPRNAPYPRYRAPASYGPGPGPGSLPPAGYGGPAEADYGPGGFETGPAPDASASMPSTPSSTTFDLRPYPPPNNEFHKSPRSNRQPPAMLQTPPVGPPPSSRWDSLPASHSPTASSSPTSPRSATYGAAAPPPVPQGSNMRARSRPTTPSANEYSGRMSDGYRDQPPRPLMSKSSFPEMRMQSQELNANSIENFSRPRKQSYGPPVSENPPRRPTLLPTPSEDGTEMFHNPLPSPFRGKRPSVASNYSASTWAPGMSPTNAEFPDMRHSGGVRGRNAGPPPVSSTRPPFGYANRIDSTGSAPTMGGGTAPWAGSDELRSSVRSQLTNSSVPGTTNTERSSVLTKDSSTTSFDAYHEADADEPSIDDLMGMYEELGNDGQNGQNDDHIGQNRPESHQSSQAEARYPSHPPHPPQLQRPPTAPEPRRSESSHSFQVEFPQFSEAPQVPQVLEAPMPPREPEAFQASQPEPQPEPRTEPFPDVKAPEQDKSRLTVYGNESFPDAKTPEQDRSRLTVYGPDAHLDQSPARAAPSKLDAEIRQSKLFFSSPAFMASVSHLSTSMNADDDDNDGEKRDSGKSMDSDPSEFSQPTPHQSTGPSPRGSNTDSFDDRFSHPTNLPTASNSVPSWPPTTPRNLNLDGDGPPVAPKPEVMEEPGLRDRYGFKKETQNITMKQYDKWDKGYSEYLARRKKKWTAFLKENALMTDNPNRFPAPGPKTRKFVRKGIPPEWRGAAWFYYAGGPAILAKHGGLYSKLLQHKAKRIDVEAIERDLHRTFPDNINFKPPGSTNADAGNHKIISEDDTVQAKPEEPPIISSLRRVLFAFSIYNPNIGYCQSLNFIAGLLLLFVDSEEQCFWLLNVITHIYLPGTHELSLEGSKVDLSVLMTEIRDTMPAVWDKIGGELEEQPASRPSTSKSLRRPKFRRRVHGSLSTERLPPITLCMTAWFMSCFIGTLPIETTLRVWDVFFYEGSKTLFRVALAIFKTGESEILSVSDPMEMFGVVQAMPRKMIDANGLMETCFKRRNGFNHLSQGAIDERRQQRRDKAQNPDKNGANGDATEGRPARRGTLFSRKKRDPSKPRAAEV